MTISRPKTKNASATAAKKQAITCDMVQQIANKVYRLWLQDAQIEQERQQETVIGNR